MRMPGIEPEVLYEVTYPSGSSNYARTPDGIGMIWYDTEEEAAADLPEDYERAEVTARELEWLRSENPSSYLDVDGSVYCAEPGHDDDPIDTRYGCRYCPPEDQ